MDILIQAAQLILSLSILIVLHEFGHFIPAKLFKTRVEKFYLFFNPWFALFKVKKGETEYGLGWLPLGGYVKIAGMIDESMDREQMEKPAQPWEFRSKPVWQRLIIMIGGVTVNLILGFLIYMMILGVWGKDYLPPENLTYGYSVPELVKKYGFEDGDIVLEVDGEKLESATELNGLVLMHNAESFLVRKANGKDTLINLPEDIDWQLFNADQTFQIRIPTVIGSFAETKSLAKNAGLEIGDRITGIDENAVNYFHEIKPIVKQTIAARFDSNSDHSFSAIRNFTTPVMITVVRDGEEISKTLNVGVQGILGVGPQEKMSDVFDIEHKDYSFLESIPAGITFGFNTLNDYIAQMKFLGSEKGISSVGGFGTFGKLFAPVWDWHKFWTMTAFISIVLAFMNILPIPALDGGHVLFLIYEMIAGRPPNQKFMEYAQLAGFVILIGLVLYANFNDVLRAFG